MSFYDDGSGFHVETSGLPPVNPLTISDSEASRLVENFRQAYPNLIRFYSRIESVQEDTVNLELESIQLGDTTYPGPISVQVTGYLAGGVAVILVTSEEGYPELLTKVSIVVPNKHPAEGCIFVKDYSENAGVLQTFIDKGWLEKTGREVKSGWVTIPEARLLGDLAELVKAATR